MSDSDIDQAINVDIDQDKPEEAQGELVDKGQAGQAKELKPAKERQIVPRETSGDISPMALISKAIDKDMSTEQIKMMMDLRDRDDAFQAKKAYTVAMADFKANAPTITKTKKVEYGNTSYSHADLGKIASQIAAEMSKYGLSHAWDIDQSDPKCIKVICIVTHSMGHSESVPMQAPADTTGSKNVIQSIGSTVTYLQRYTLVAITGLAAGDEDDDGVNASPEGDQQTADHDFEFYPEQSFKEFFPKWEKSIKAGSKSKEALIAYILKTHLLSDANRKQINDIEVAAK